MWNVLPLSEFSFFVLPQYTHVRTIFNTVQIFILFILLSHNKYCSFALLPRGYQWVPCGHGLTTHTEWNERTNARQLRYICLSRTLARSTTAPRALVAKMRKNGFTKCTRRTVVLGYACPRVPELIRSHSVLCLATRAASRPCETSQSAQTCVEDRGREINHQHVKNVAVKQVLAIRIIVYNKKPRVKNLYMPK